MPKGTECYTSVKVDEDKCLIPCKGLFADVLRNNDFKQITDRETLSRMLASYEDYKTGNTKRSSYSKNVAGYESKTKLHWVKIYFATPTFERILKDEKANFEARLSAIGGTMGLLTGFSIISRVEINYYVVKICLGLSIKKRRNNFNRNKKKIYCNECFIYKILIKFVLLFLILVYN